MDRNETIKRIRKALKRRSGKTWSVTGGRGTAWGWIRIDAPPKRRTEHTVGNGHHGDYPENYERKDTGEPGGHMTLADRTELAQLLSLDRPVHFQGCNIPAGHDYWQEYIDRAEGRTPSVVGKPYAGLRIEHRKE